MKAKFAAVLAAAMASLMAQDKSTISLTLENDSYFGTDEYYTQGLRIQYMAKPNQVPEWTEKTSRTIPLLGLDISRTRLGFALGQEIYTPARIGPRTLLVNDRPYGAWMHGSVVLRRAGEFAGRIPAMDELELDLGIIGPEALGEETQSWWHDTVDYIQPRGWSHQLKTEPALQLYGSRSLQFGCRTDNYWGLDFVPGAKVALGNVYVYGQLGALVRFGYNLPLEYVVSPLESFSTHPSYDPPKWSVYGFAGADGRAVARNLFLDGNSFRDSHSVAKEHFVADLRAGGAVRYRAVEMVVSVVHRTREFKLQPKAEHFMSITMQYHF